jgi:Sec-independent protein secretion pathway component TatC
MWFAFVILKNLNVRLQITVFVATLVALPAILYHSVEAPLIAAGVNISERLKPLPLLPQGNRRAA